MNKDYGIYLVTDSNILKNKDFYTSIEQSLKAGVKTLQLREKDASGKEFLEKAYKLREMTKKYNTDFIINDRVDIALLVDADGVHVGQSDICAKDVRRLIGDNKILGVSAKNLCEAQKAKDDGADYIGVGAMFRTKTKLDADDVSMNDLENIRKNLDIDVVAIGGINLENISLLTKYNLEGYAIVSSILKSEDIYKVTKDFIYKIKR